MGFFIIFFTFTKSICLNSFHSVIIISISAFLIALYASSQNVTFFIIFLAFIIATGSYTLIIACSSCSFLITVIDGASRISSVSGLNDKPNIATTLFLTDPSSSFLALLAILAIEARLISSTSCRRENSYPDCLEIAIRALTSLGKQLPPYPAPGERNELPIRLSYPMPLNTLSPSAPVISDKCAIAFAKDIFVAKKAFAAYLIISAVRTFVNTTFPSIGLCNSKRRSLAFSVSVPITILSGCSVSDIACPSLKNSGVDAMSTIAFGFLFVKIISFTF